MVFANGWMLALGVMAIAVPIVVHLLSRSRPKPTLFPAVRLLSHSVTTQRRRLQLKQWLLLAMRIAALAWLAIALAQPSVPADASGRWTAAFVWGVFAVGGVGLLVGLLASRKPPSRWLIGAVGAGTLVAASVSTGAGIRAWWEGRTAPPVASDGPIAAVVVVDVAPRMSYLHDSRTRLEVAQELGAWVLRRLPPESRAAIVSTAGGTPFFAVDTAAALRQLEALEIRAVHGSLTQSLRDALDLLGNQTQERREIYVLTDRARNAWPEGEIATEVRRRLEEAKVSLYLLDVRAPEVVNRSLSVPRLIRESIADPGVLELELDVTAEPDSEIPVVLKVERPDPSRPVRRDGVTLLPDRHWTRQALARTDATGRATLSLSLPDLPIGVHHGTIELPTTDSAAFDDRRYLSVEVRSAWNGLIVAPDETLTAVLEEAIAPSAEREAGRASWRFQRVRPQELGRTDLEQFDAIFVIDPTPLDAATWSLLRTRVAEGAGLAVFLGAQAISAEGAIPAVIDASFVSAEAREVLPGVPTEVWRSGGEGTWLVPADLNHPLLEPFRGRETTVPWRTFPVSYHWGWEPVLEPVAGESDGESERPRIQVPRVVMTYADGAPAVVEGELGAGRVVVWTTPLGEDPEVTGFDRWNRLTIGECWPYFLLINQLANRLVSREDSRVNLRVGELGELIWPTPDRPEWIQSFPPGDAEPERLRGERGRWEIRFTETPGSYRFKGGEEEVRTLGFSVNLPDVESDFEEITEESLRELLGEDRFQTARETAELDRQQGTARRGLSFFGLMILLLPAFLVVERLFADRFHAKVAAPIEGSGKERAR